MAGFVTAVIYVRSLARAGGAVIILRVRLGAGFPLRPRQRRRRWPPRWSPLSVPGHGKIVGLAVMALAAMIYVAVLVATREFGPEDRAKFARVLRRR